MATKVQEMIEKYRRDHQHPVNRALHTVGIPMIIASLGVLPFNPLLGTGMFVFGWILQFVGHAFEGKWPSFFSDPRFLGVGAMWFFRKITGKESATA